MNCEWRKGQAGCERSRIIKPDMTILDMISEYPETGAIFKDLEAETGVCVRCQGLFLSLQEAAKRFGFDLEIIFLSDCVFAMQ